MNKDRKAFTLAEVLIALTIIGVVAALTVPTMIQSYQEKATVAKLRTAYSTFSQAVYMAKIDNGPIDTWDIGTANTEEGALKLYNILKPYLKIQKDCGLSNGCFADNYTTMNNNRFSYQPNTYSVYTRGVLVNNVAFVVWSNGSGCKQGYANDSCGSVFVDINGSLPPNQAGNDFFGFYITTSGIKPFNDLRIGDDVCVLSSSSNGTNGLGCTSLVLDKGNLDYLKKL